MVHFCTDKLQPVATDNTITHSRDLKFHGINGSSLPLHKSHIHQSFNEALKQLNAYIHLGNYFKRLHIILFPFPVLPQTQYFLPFNLPVLSYRSAEKHLTCKFAWLNPQLCKGATNTYQNGSPSDHHIHPQFACCVVREWRVVSWSRGSPCRWRNRVMADVVAYMCV